MKTGKSLGIALALLPACTSVSMARPMAVARAVYGTLGSGKVCDATPAIASMCTGRSVCSVPIGNSLCSDSDFLVVKAARIDYTCGRTHRSVVSGEYTTAVLSCD